MANTIKIKNIKTKVESDVTDEQWAAIQKDKQWQGVFAVVKTTPVSSSSNSKQDQPKEADKK